MDLLTKVPFKVKLNTDGQGFWSGRVAQVRVTHLQVPYIDDEDGEFGELRVYFDRRTWSVDSHGLIYTDAGWLTELRAALTQAGFDASDIGYSEQGMQGDSWVSLDVGPKFLASWLAQHQNVPA